MAGPWTPAVRDLELVMLRPIFVKILDPPLVDKLVAVVVVVNIQFYNLYLPDWIFDFFRQIVQVIPKKKKKQR